MTDMAETVRRMERQLDRQVSELDGLKSDMRELRTSYAQDLKETNATLHAININLAKVNVKMASTDKYKGQITAVAMSVISLMISMIIGYFFVAK